MGGKGPRRTPTAILRLRGSQLVKYHGRGENEPTPPPADQGAPYRPRWLRKMGKLAVEYWDRICPYLDRMGVLAKCDEGALASLCVIWARWREAEEYIAKHGPDVEHMIGDFDNPVVEVKQHPVVKRALAYHERLTKMWALFGLSPADRAALEIPGRAEKKRDDLEDKLFGGSAAK